MSTAAVIAWAVNPSSPAYSFYGAPFLRGATKPGVREETVPIFYGGDSWFQRHHFYLHSCQRLHLETWRHSFNTAMLELAVDEGMCGGGNTDHDTTTATPWSTVEKHNTLWWREHFRLLRSADVRSFVCIERESRSGSAVGEPAQAPLAHPPPSSPLCLLQRRVRTAAATATSSLQQSLCGACGVRRYWCWRGKQLKDSF